MGEVDGPPFIDVEVLAVDSPDDAEGVLASIHAAIELAFPDSDELLMRSSGSAACPEWCTEFETHPEGYHQSHTKRWPSGVFLNSST